MMEYYVQAPVQAIIENIDDATFPARHRLELSQQEIHALMQRGRGIRQATVAQYFVR